jgi:hypothetical protein
MRRSGWIALPTMILAVLLVSCGGRPLEVRVRNRTDSPVVGLSLVSAAGRTELATIPAGSEVSVRPPTGESEDHMLLVTPGGDGYLVLPYYEEDPRGRVTVTILAIHGDSLSGFVDDRTVYCGTGEHPLVQSR